MWRGLCPRWRLRGLIAAWVAYRKEAAGRLGTGGEDSAAAGERLLRLRARIAQRLPLLTTAVPEPLRAEAREQAAAITEILNRPLPGEAAPGAQPWDWEEFESRWRAHFIFLHMLRGVRLATAGAPAAGGLSVPNGLSRRRRPLRLPGARWAGGLIRLALLAAAAYIVARTLGLRWDTAGRFVLEPPAGAEGWARNLGLAVKGIGLAAAGLLAPVVAAYGATVTVVLLAVLGVALVCWRYLRG
ncbi:MAG: hypothetical protein FJY75_05960 [Candidatus Eisenbacteria bacterium]|uniref:Uncharacterized protein n=1 Tax=Eiseniibacteriota bacterium TaxID=2212470 RepID=A0A937XB64_UNCEI|nr:hypothetical protein [Candidatus Eisenbacteria bacterium]